MLFIIDYNKTDYFVSNKFCNCLTFLRRRVAGTAKSKIFFCIKYNGQRLLRRLYSYLYGNRITLSNDMDMKVNILLTYYIGVIEKKKWIKGCCAITIM